jgi:hypothetical protein
MTAPWRHAGGRGNFPPPRAYLPGAALGSGRTPDRRTIHFRKATKEES